MNSGVKRYMKVIRYVSIRDEDEFRFLVARNSSPERTCRYILQTIGLVKKRYLINDDARNYIYPRFSNLNYYLMYLFVGIRTENNVVWLDGSENKKMVLLSCTFCNNVRVLELDRSTFLYNTQCFVFRDMFTFGRFYKLLGDKKYDGEGWFKPDGEVVELYYGELNPRYSWVEK